MCVPKATILVQQGAKGQRQDSMLSRHSARILCSYVVLGVYITKNFVIHGGRLLSF